MPHVASRLRIMISSAEGVRASVGNLTISSSLCRLGRSTGNAHTRNLLTDHGRVVLLDFESSAIGPREWDLLDLLPTAIATDRYGLPTEHYQQFAEAYGFDVRTWPGYPVLAGDS